jgi:hypothetical protein
LRICAWWFVGTLAAGAATMAAVGAWAVPQAGDLGASGLEQPPAGHYLAHSRAGHTDHHVLYHGLDPVTNERLDSADVLWLGNSRLQFALRRSVLRPFFSPRSLSYFVLGFGHEETFHFPLSILDRRKLRPTVVLVNVDGFFVGPPSEWAVGVMTDSRFDAFKWWFENEAAHESRLLLHAWLPHWPDRLSSRRDMVVHRSRLDGTWFVGTPEVTVGPLPVSLEATPPVEERVTNARAFVERMRAQGTSVIFCLVPGPSTSRATAESLAQQVGVPLLAPELDMPLTMDGSHLTEESATEFAALLLDALEPHLEGLGL